jgi:hypothetical protein
VENSGSSSSWPSLIRPWREAASHRQTIRITLTMSMMNQPRLVNIAPTVVAAKAVSPAVSTIPQTAIAPVMARAIKRSGFVNMAPS